MLCSNDLRAGPTCEYEIMMEFPLKKKIIIDGPIMEIMEDETSADSWRFENHKPKHASQVIE